MFKHILNKFKPKNDLENIYSANLLPVTYRDCTVFPQKEFLASKHIFAYKLSFMLTDGDASRVFGLLVSSFHPQNREVYQECSVVRRDATSIHFSIHKEFGGAVFEIVTNDIPFLEALDNLKPEPPTPWQVFPHFEPATLGARQGAMDYWWTWYWSPFWDSLSEEGRQEFLNRKMANSDWKEYLLLAR